MIQWLQVRFHDYTGQMRHFHNVFHCFFLFYVHTLWRYLVFLLLFIFQEPPRCDLVTPKLTLISIIYYYLYYLLLYSYSMGETCLSGCPSCCLYIFKNSRISSLAWVEKIGFPWLLFRGCSIPPPSHLALKNRLESHSFKVTPSTSTKSAQRCYPS